MTGPVERQELIQHIHEAIASGCRLENACKEVDLCVRTYRRWYRGGEIQLDARPNAVRVAPSHQLSETEREAIIAVCNEPEYASLPPSQIVPALLDKGIYLASESSFHRILRSCGQLHHRGREKKRRQILTPKTHIATGPNQVWSWDITYLPSRIKGQHYYLYCFEDIYSRKIVGYEVHARECGDLAADVLQRCMMRERCFKQGLVLHSDNGAPMKSLTLRAKMSELNVQSSFSRPRVSNDNAYSESLFRTLKYRPNWPFRGFSAISDARDWVQDFVDWYNEEHKHSKLRFVTPAQRHAGVDGEILMKRSYILSAAKSKNPTRWSRDIRNCAVIGPVSLNPESLVRVKKAA